MYISKKIEVSWNQEEESTIKDFRLFLEDTAEKVKDALPSLYKQLNKIDNSLYAILYQSFDEDFDLDDTEDE